MPPRRRSEPSTSESRRRPATTPENRENQLVAKAARLAEQQIDDGTASSQVLIHYLKLGSTRERLEQQRLRHENELLQVKRDAIAAQGRMEELYKEAIQAMRTYGGHNDEVDQNE